MDDHGHSCYVGFQVASPFCLWYSVHLLLINIKAIFGIIGLLLPVEWRVCILSDGHNVFPIYSNSTEKFGKWVIFYYTIFFLCLITHTDNTNFHKWIQSNWLCPKSKHKSKKRDHTLCFLHCFHCRSYKF